jgi:hypothetical protein
MGCQVVKRRESLSNDKRPNTNIIQHLRRERLLREQLNLIVEYISLNDITSRREKESSGRRPILVKIRIAR